jgi:hypothetical protein
MNLVAAVRFGLQESDGTCGLHGFDRRVGQPADLLGHGALFPELLGQVHHPVEYALAHAGVLTMGRDSTSTAESRFDGPNPDQRTVNPVAAGPVGEIPPARARPVT